MSEQNSVGIMVAPNGARLTTDDHPMIPVTLDDTVDCVQACQQAGALAVHLHVRDENQAHVLDAERYLALTDKLRQRLGGEFPIQITTEAVGQYSPAEQIALVRAVRPEFASVALAEMVPDDSHLHAAEAFYHWCSMESVGVQHILYSAEHLGNWLSLKARGVIPADHNSVLFVLGRYTEGQQSDPASIDDFLNRLDTFDPGPELNWMICAFGVRETDCLARAASLGGHVRIGFENNRLHEDGSVADSNQDRVEAMVNRLKAQAQELCDVDRMRTLLGA